jgi:deoxyribodipyrimidine photolyase-related protein
MSVFRQRLDASTAPDPGRRRWIFVNEDQLSDRIGPLSREDPADVGIVLVQSTWKARRRPYHRQRLLTVWANQRHFALEQAARGVAVRYVDGDQPYAATLGPLVEDLGPLTLMEPAERELRADLEPLVESGALEVVEHEGWLSTPEDFRDSVGDEPPWRMDRFYRHLRQKTGILVEDGRPAGGKYSHDAENRQPWKGDPPAPDPPTFPRDEITDELAARIERDFGDHPGRLDPAAVPSTADDARRAWDWAREHALPVFGPFEDAMSARSSTLFHTRLSTLMNLHRLLPREVLDGAVALDLPLASQEGFVRQVLGWREFVRHVHRETDGFRRLASQDVEVAVEPGDGGWSAWSGEDWPRVEAGSEPDGGAWPDLFGVGDGSLAPAWWGVPSGMACLDHVVADVWRDGWSHHITRLMVLSNLSTLLDFDPRTLTDWFWVAYTDAWDWVVEPNVLGMGTYAVGDVMTTKPYVSGTPYIHRMSDYCADCAFDPKKNCPISNLYWAFLERHGAHFEDNHRMSMPLRSSAKRKPTKREEDRRVFEFVRRRLLAAGAVTPSDLDAVRRGEEVTP